MIAVAIAFVVALLTGLAAMPWVIAHLAAAGLTGNDVNKPDRPSIPNIGGIAVVFGLAFGVLVAIAVSATGAIPAIDEGPMLGALTCVLLVALIGLVDDLLRMPPVLKGTLPVLAAIPLLVMGDGSTDVTVPVLGVVGFGLLYPLILVPIGITGAANVTNMLAGFNGIEAGMGSVACLSLGLIALRDGHTESAVLLFAMLGALLVLLRFSWFPAKVFPGDTATLSIGAVLAAAVVVGRFEIAGDHRDHPVRHRLRDQGAQPVPEHRLVGHLDRRQAGPRGPADRPRAGDDAVDRRGDRAAARLDHDRARGARGRRRRGADRAPLLRPLSPACGRPWRAAPA